MTTGTLLAVCRVHELRPDVGNGVTAIDKRPVGVAVKVRTLGLYGDVQVDRKHHGGADKALYAYSQQEAEFWAAELGREVPPGMFGENLRTAGIETTRAVIGERWKIGASVIAEVTMARTPCATFQRRMREPRWVKRFTDVGLIGTYLRVVTKGAIQAGDEITVISRPAHGITVGKFFSSPTADDVRTLTKLHDDGELQLARALRPYFEKILRADS
ncbi:MOSC domain-containing protein [Paenarthrobacter sp. PH39-S1]|uniref:MOSC domain-containing protein n=1 Tax=Paenarthrobacter sp. PH39-S1 TaxID=3046204 RepID=UPI0024B900BC|nr:MOSC domain-containing protein [Paenarthrobacter sp. PH39-S1]MDJ0358385.1 MOSC domain-containing protein [Paenarthrobacter sp. PH39-S1]